MSMPSWIRACRVGGSEGPRVVEAAATPKPMGGNTNLSTIVIAEKAAQRIDR